MNQHSGKPQYISKDTIKILQTSLKLAPLTFNRFDIGVGNFLSRSGLDETVPKVGKQPLTEKENTNDLLLGIDGHMVRLHRPNTMLDLGGIGKGYALDEAIKVLVKHGIQHAAIDLGGDLVVHGGKSPGQPWTIGLDPRAQLNESSKTYQLMTGAVASSGDYYRPNHIIDPIALKPLHRYTLTTVIGPNATYSDALATAAFNTPKAEQFKLERNFSEYQFYWL